MRSGLTVARIGADIVGAHDADAAEGRLEHCGVSRQLKILERRTRDARQRVELIPLASRIGHIVEERPELGAGKFCRRVGHRLYDMVEIEIAGDRLCDPVDSLQPASAALRSEMSRMLT